MAEAASVGVAPHNPLGPIAGVLRCIFAVLDPQPCHFRRDGGRRSPGT